MSLINILDAQTSNMIAAGEVVDRPASALKELIENSIDAHATEISVEIKGGGREFMRVTDNGSGIMREDLPKALLRHATSKIKSGSDLEGIATMGFRGEALAAIAAVCRLEIISKQREDKSGTRLCSDENGVTLSDVGCPNGTSVIVHDLFYNTPARQKFLKRDATEGSAALGVAERLAVSHPEIAFSVTINSEKRFFTSGDGKLLSALYSVYGREFASSLIEADYTLAGVSVYGYVSKPENSRGSRNLQNFFVNGRYVKSGTVMAALEEANRAYIPHGKFPAAMLFITVSPFSTDVNIHPAKLEIKFSDEKKIFSAVYYAVANAVNSQKRESPASDAPFAEQLPITEVPKAQEPQKATVPPVRQSLFPQKSKDSFGKSSQKIIGYEVFNSEVGLEGLPAGYFGGNLAVCEPQTEQAPPKTPEKVSAFRVIGQAYDAYIFIQAEDCVYIIDKHAVHERILYETLKNKKEMHTQTLLTPVVIKLPSDEAQTLLDEAEHLSSYGFDIKKGEKGGILILTVPAALSKTADLAEILEQFAFSLSRGDNLPFAEKCQKSLFTVACKAALKAGIKNDKAHDEWVAGEFMKNETLRVCPHGRPFYKIITKREIEKYFDR